MVFSVSPSHTPTGILVPFAGDEQGDDAAALVEHDAVDHEDRRVVDGEITREQLGQLLGGRSHEASRDGRARVAFGERFELFSDGLGDEGVASRRHPGQHAFDGELAEQVPIIESVVRVEVDLAATGLGGAGSARGTVRPPSTTEPGADPFLVAVRSGSWRPLGPALSVISAAMISSTTARPAAQQNAMKPSLMAAERSWRATVASAGSSARRAASSRAATVTTGSFFFIGGGPLLVGGGFGFDA